MSRGSFSNFNVVCGSIVNTYNIQVHTQAGIGTQTKMREMKGKKWKVPDSLTKLHYGEGKSGMAVAPQGDSKPVKKMVLRGYGDVRRQH